MGTNNAICGCDVCANLSQAELNNIERIWTEALTGGGPDYETSRAACQAAANRHRKSYRLAKNFFGEWGWLVVPYGSVGELIGPL